MNLKKSGGGGVANQKEICKIAERDKDLILEQIDIIAPEIIVLGLSWGKLRNIIFENEVKEWESSSHGILLGKYKDSKVIDYYHPSARNAPPAAYYLLEKIINSKAFKQL